MRWIRRKIPKKSKAPSLIARVLNILVSATVAAWLQAIGSIIALGLTVSLYQQAQDKAQENNKKLVAAFLDQMINSSDDIITSCQFKDRRRLEVSLLALDDAFEIGRQIQFSELEAQDIGLLSAIRRLFSVLRARTRTELNNKTITGAYWSDCLEFVPGAAGAASLLLKAYADDIKANENFFSSTKLGKYQDELSKFAEKHTENSASAPQK